MSKRAFDKIAEGLREAIAIARGERKPAKLFVPPEPGRAIRARLELPQEAIEQRGEPRRQAPAPAVATVGASRFSSFLRPR